MPLENPVISLAGTSLLVLALHPKPRYETLKCRESVLFLQWQLLSSKLSECFHSVPLIANIIYQQTTGKDWGKKSVVMDEGDNNCATEDSNPDHDPQNASSTQRTLQVSEDQERY